MFENDAKGWFGNYSVAGRNSAEKYHIIVHKEEILNGEKKKIIIKDIFTPDEPQQVESLEDNLDIFKVYSSENKDKIGVISKSPNKKPLIKLVKKDKFQYHNKHMMDLNKRKKKSGESYSRYYPRYEYIWPRLITGPEWEIVKGRTYKKIPKDTKNFFYRKSSVLEAKTLVNMNKTTIRGDFSNMGNDVRIRTDGPFHSNTFKNNRNKTSHTTNQISTDNTNNNSKFSKTYTKFRNNSNNLNVDTESIDINTNSNNPNFTNPNIIPHYKNENRAPDFRKTISREQREKAKGFKTNAIPFVMPNYSLVRERALTMAVYDKPVPVRSKVKYMKGVHSGIMFNPDLVIDKVNNHIESKSPNFKLMTSRPNKKGSPLPSYMQKNVDRKSVYLINDKSLEMNNYPNGNFMSATTSFWPKKSFNNIINLNLMRSKKFKEKDTDEALENKKELLKSQMNFSHKNFDTLIKEGALNKFDNVTYKTIHHEHKINPGDMEKFLANFDNVDV